MKIVEVKNPFNAPVYHEETVTSTMDISRALAKKGEPHGTVIVSDFQENGRGRTQERKWQTENSTGLLFTILLRYGKTEDIPCAVTLKTGLAISFAAGDFSPCLYSLIKIKWPNDIMVNDKKIAGILSESDGQNVYIGIGVNLTQEEFPEHIKRKASSIALESKKKIPHSDRFLLLEKILSRLYDELNSLDTQISEDSWKVRFEKRLYKKNEKVLFTKGEAGSGKMIEGVIRGIADNGELLIAPCGEENILSFVTGEISFL